MRLAVRRLRSNFAAPVVRDGGTVEGRNLNPRGFEVTIRLPGAG